MQPFKQAKFPDDALQARTDDVGATVWLNDRYQVVVTPVTPVLNQTRLIPEGEFPAIVWLSIKRRDRQPIHDWRDLQEIKNQLVGPECEGVELYPAESRLVDESNQFHLWVIREPNVHWPFGYHTRSVMTPEELAADTSEHARKAVQRPFGEGRAGRRRRHRYESLDPEGGVYTMADIKAAAAEAARQYEQRKKP